MKSFTSRKEGFLRHTCNQFQNHPMKFILFGDVAANPRNFCGVS